MKEMRALQEGRNLSGGSVFSRQSGLGSANPNEMRPLVSTAVTTIGRGLCSFRGLRATRGGKVGHRCCVIL